MIKGGGIFFKRGFTIIEVLVDISIISIIAIAVLSAYSAGFKAMEAAKTKIAAVALANEKMEDLRNLSYDSLATKNGAIYPSGNILDNQIVTRRGVNFLVKTVIYYVDDEYDGNVNGTISGKPQDFYPYDYKKAEIIVLKENSNIEIAKLVSNFSAKAAETSSNSGIINVCVVDESSTPVVEANVNIINSNLNPAVNISAKTGSDGCLMVPNLPPDEKNQYHLAVTKDGFSSDMTYPRTVQNPNSLQPDVNVLSQQVTNQTFSIDLLGKMKIKVLNQLGSVLGNTSVHINSVKEKWFNPSVPVYENDIMTDTNGEIVLENMFFGDYMISVNDKSVLTTSPYQAVHLKAGSELEVLITTGSTNNLAILNAEPITAKANGTLNLALSGKNFDSGLTIKLTDSSGDEIVGTNVVVKSGQSIEADFNMINAKVGLWNIIVINPSGEKIIQHDGLEVKNE